MPSWFHSDELISKQALNFWMNKSRELARDIGEGLLLLLLPTAHHTSPLIKLDFLEREKKNLLCPRSCTGFKHTYIQYAWKLWLLYSFFARFIELFSDFIAHKHVAGWVRQSVHTWRLRNFSPLNLGLSMTCKTVVFWSNRRLFEYWVGGVSHWPVRSVYLLLQTFDSNKWCSSHLTITLDPD